MGTTEGVGPRMREDNGWGGYSWGTLEGNHPILTFPLEGEGICWGKGRGRVGTTEGVGTGMREDTGGGGYSWGTLEGITPILTFPPQGGRDLLGQGEGEGWRQRREWVPAFARTTGGGGYSWGTLEGITPIPRLHEGRLITFPPQGGRDLLGQGEGVRRWLWGLRGSRCRRLRRGG